MHHTIMQRHYTKGLPFDLTLVDHTVWMVMMSSTQSLTHFLNPNYSYHMPSHKGMNSWTDQPLKLKALLNMQAELWYSVATL